MNCHNVHAPWKSLEIMIKSSRFCFNTFHLTIYISLVILSLCKYANAAEFNKGIGFWKHWKSPGILKSTWGCQRLQPYHFGQKISHFHAYFDHTPITWDKPFSYLEPKNINKILATLVFVITFFFVVNHKI